MFKGFITQISRFLFSLFDYVLEVYCGILPFSLQGESGPPGPPGSPVSMPIYYTTPKKHRTGHTVL